MVRVPYYSNFTTLKKGSWSPEEDRKLKAYIKRYGIWNWAEMPKAAGLSRSGKSCRLRWVNYLKPGIRRGNFSREEEETILKLHGIMGNRWSAIAARLPGRTDNEIKNYWHTKLRKLKGSINITNPAAQIRTKSQAKGKTPISSTVTYQDSPKEEAGFSIMMGGSGSDQQQPYAWSPQLPIDFSSSSSASTSKVAIVGAGDEILGISENPFSASDSSSPSSSSSSSSVTSGVMEGDLEAFPLLMGEELFMLGDYFNWEITCPDLGDDQDWVQEPLWT